MSLKKLVIGFSLLLGLSTAFAANAEIAAKVISIKTPVVDNQVTHHHATEVFMELINNGKQQHELIAATSPAAKQVQLHMTVKKNGKMAMQQIHGITIKTRSDEDLHLGGLHVMLIGLKHKLAKNQRVPITLIFNDGSWKTINAKVS